MENPTQVFVYGTLKPGGQYHDEFCGQFTFAAFPAQIHGAIFNFPKLGYPAVVETNEDWVLGFLLKFDSPKNAVLERLDYLEGYSSTRPSTENEYYRKEVEVFSAKDRSPISKAWCYFMTAEKVASLGGVRVIDGDWKI